MVHHRRRANVQIPDRLGLFLDGVLGVDDLDDEEILRGQLRAKDGTFRGRPPALVPRMFTDAIRIRRQRLWDQEMEEMVQDAHKAIKDITTNPNPMPGDAARLAAAKFILERARGKTPDNINIKAQVESWEKNMEQTIVDVDWSEVDDTKEIEE